ncbi:hypothetical protein SAMN04488116_0444 [Flagellimonas flava]|uniref:Putative auto-transporter adhesin head GIN domain-containing protein n=2 Tax=Flagellimonas flava TaxID=570519 RepID=A0A1M5I4Z9_9FLAO|nr:hypothetical protein SAMN04488116_0444 [Allomuricauda flava]
MSPLRKSKVLITNTKMKKSNLILIGALVALFFFTLLFQLTVHSHVKKEKAAIKPVEILTRNRDIDEFSFITADGPVTVVFTQSPTRNLQLKTPNYFMDSISTVVQNNMLSINLGKGLKSKDSVVIRITNSSLAGLLLQSKAVFNSDGELSGDSLSLEFKDESAADIQLNYGTIHYSNSSTGQISLEGNLSQIKLKEHMKE